MCIRDRVQAGDDLDGEAAGDQSGYAIAINAFGNIIASGAPNNAGSGTGSGHVRVYQSNLCNIPLNVDYSTMQMQRLITPIRCTAQMPPILHQTFQEPMEVYLVQQLA